MKLPFLSKYLCKQAPGSKNVAFRKLYRWTIDIWRIDFFCREDPCWTWEWAWGGEGLATLTPEAALRREKSWSRNLAAIEEAGLDWSELSQSLLREASGGSRELGERFTAAQATTHQAGLGNITLGLREYWGHQDTQHQQSRNHFHLWDIKVWFYAYSLALCQ